jgi:hypothetical protein
MSMIAQMNISRWNILALGLIVAAMLHLSAATKASRFDDGWPALLLEEPSPTDAAVALLQQRANGSLEKLMRSAEQPL